MSRTFGTSPAEPFCRGQECMAWRWGTGASYANAVIRAATGRPARPVSVCGGRTSITVTR